MKIIASLIGVNLSFFAFCVFYSQFKQIKHGKGFYSAKARLYCVGKFRERPLTYAGKVLLNT